jgi:FtsZ-interacting cell division protein ZipA
MWTICLGIVAIVVIAFVAWRSPRDVSSPSAMSL